MARKINAIIIDDEEHGRTLLSNVFSEYCPEIKLCGSFNCAIDAKKYLYTKKPDVIFLDVNMPDINGFEFLEMITNIDFYVVFVSAHSEYAIKAIKVNAVDFLLKPLCIKEVQKCIKRLSELINTDNVVEKNQPATTKILVPSFQGFKITETDQIVRITADDNYSKIHFTNKSITTISKTLKYFEDMKCSDFFRVHKSHIINIKHIKEFSNIDGGYVIMLDGTKIEVSRRRIPEFIKIVKNKL